MMTNIRRKNLQNSWEIGGILRFPGIARGFAEACSLQDSMSCYPDAKAPAYGQGL
jgi:hypothetical protein